MAGIYLATLTLLACPHLGRPEATCPRGHRLHSPGAGPDLCVTCEDGLTFMPEAHHSHRKCHDCTKVDNPDLETVVSPCNLTRDTSILCRAGYYRYTARNDRERDACQLCRQCENPARACGGYQDTVCCLAGQGSIVVEGGVVICAELSLECGQGGVPCLGGSEEGWPDKGGGNSLLTGAITGASQVSQQTGVDISNETTTTCSQGFYLHTNLSDGISTCRPCHDEALVNNSTVESILQHPAGCNTTRADAGELYTNLGVVNIVLFSLAVLVDVLYILLFSHNFIKRSPGRWRGNSSLRTQERTSRMIGTLGVDLHVVLVCVHSFGVLCEVGVVAVSLDTMWAFTVGVGVLTIVVYFLDALLFVLVKRLACVTTFFLEGPGGVPETDDSSSQHAQPFLDST